LQSRAPNSTDSLHTTANDNPMVAKENQIPLASSHPELFLAARRGANWQKLRNKKRAIVIVIGEEFIVVVMEIVCE
jgi:hypothetical protein